MLLQADARALPLADASVQCVITSPPYLGLRDYGLPPSVWDGDPACAHVWGAEGRSAQRLRNGQGSTTVDPVACPVTLHPFTGSPCVLCGAWRGVLGLEPTPELYVAHMVTVFREVRRVLRDDGVVWLNLGDSYAANNGSGPQGQSGQRATRTFTASTIPKYGDGLKPKDLVGIPWRVAFALQADGWYLRSDCIWAKPNPMPESVTDRPTKAHEYLFLLAKAERYFYDAEAIKETGTGRASGRVGEDKAGSGPGFEIRGGFTKNGDVEWHTRSRRSVWTIATQPTPDAHFATFPEALVVPCVLAGTSEAGACGVCGAPWERTVNREFQPTQNPAFLKAGRKGLDASNGWDTPRGRINSTTIGWRPTCAHTDAPRVPCTVLDPFGGTATVGAVAERLGRRWVATDLKPEYLALARRRTAQRGLPFLATTNGHVAPRPVALAGSL